MKHADAHAAVEGLRRMTQLWLPPLTDRRGFSSTRVEHLLNRLVAAMPANELYLEVGSLEGRTLDAAAFGNINKRLIGCDPGYKYDTLPLNLPRNVRFFPEPWETAIQGLEEPIGCAFYDAEHGVMATSGFLTMVARVLADEAVVVLDDWDRASVRDGAFQVMSRDPRWAIIREMPEYGDGMTCPPNYFGWFFGIVVLGFRR